MQERVRKDHVPYDQWQKMGWVTATEGNVVDYTVIKDVILRSAKLFNIQEVCSDRAFATMLLQEVEKAGLICVDIPQTFMSLTNPLNETERLLGERKITHEANPVAQVVFR